MTGSCDGHQPTGNGGLPELERRYRRLLRVFPPSYRADREDEIVGVLLDRAAPDQQRPTVPETMDLIRAGLAARGRVLRRSPAPGEWRPVVPLVAIVLAVLLAAQGARYAVLVIASTTWGDQAPPLAWLVPGWYVAALWIAVVGLLVAGAARLAAAVAWLAVVARVFAVLELSGSVGGVQGIPAWGRAPYIAQPTVWHLTLGLVTAILLSRPAAVRAAILASGRARLAGATAVIFAMGLLAFWRDPASGMQPWGWLVSVALLSWWWWWARGGEDVDDRRAVAARVAGALAVVFTAFVVSRGWSAASSPDVVSRLDLVLAFGFGLVTVIAGAIALVLLPALARAIPFRIVRRRS